MNRARVGYRVGELIGGLAILAAFFAHGGKFIEHLHADVRLFTSQSAGDFFFAATVEKVAEDVDIEKGRHALLVNQTLRLCLRANGDR